MARVRALLDPTTLARLEHRTTDLEHTGTMRRDHLPADLRAPMPNGRAYYRLVQSVYDRAGGLCWLCGGPVPRDQASLDHRLPRALGGGNELENLALAHRRPQRDTGCPGNYGRGTGAPRRRGGGGGAVGTSREW